MDRYTHVELERLDEGLRKLPRITGCDSDGGPGLFTGQLTGALDSECPPASSDDREEASSDDEGDERKPKGKAIFDPDCRPLATEGMARPVGLEPTTLGLEIRPGSDASGDPERGLRREGEAAYRPAYRNDEQDLARLVAAWPSLPPHIRAAILTLIDAAVGSASLDEA